MRVTQEPGMLEVHLLPAVPNIVQRHKVSCCATQFDLRDSRLIEFVMANWPRISVFMITNYLKIAIICGYKISVEFSNLKKKNCQLLSPQSIIGASM